MRPSRVLLTAESFAAKNSGIGRVARLMARVLADWAETEGFRCTGVSLSDLRDQSLAWNWVTPCKGRRFEFVARVQTASLRADWVFYDSLSMARAHFMGPALIRPTLAWMHGIDAWEKAWPEHLRVARSVDVLVTNSEYTQGRASALHANLERARVCWLGTETDEPTPERTQSHNTDRNVLLLARIDLDSYKGHKELIEIWPTVADRAPGARLIIAGDGPGLDAVKDLAMRSPVSSQIEVLGYIQEAEIPKLWSQATVFAMPSRGEGFGLVYIEAMRQGVPVIASLQDAGQEINVHGETGFNVDLEQPTELINALTALLMDPEKAHVMGMSGRARWERWFTYHAFRNRFDCLLSESGFPIYRKRLRADA
ncbi:MAG: glycosyltransferase family 4 protein [Gammaproteobacteria bacterium]